ncbi:MAG TPA: hypothetical protein VMG98_08185 [Verrucomicrobiae bacterium]|nr:hypothetical protein [Verrucomicrobiae bacterium]HTZ54662.1 hypothetical protein [Candidatus Acidoferrum sp.]
MSGRLQRFAGILFCALISTSAVAPASVDLATGIRHVVPTGTIADCDSKASAALGAYLQHVLSPTQDEWVGTGPKTEGIQSDTTSAGTIRCFAHAGGYVVTFTCSVEAPNNPYTATALCDDLLNNFEGQPQIPLATPTPPPSGCTTASLAGVWQSDNSKMTLTLDQDGELTDSDNVIGSWVLNGLNVKLTYYGYHNLTLSSDGKHMSGSGYSFTRKC